MQSEKLGRIIVAALLVAGIASGCGGDPNKTAEEIALVRPVQDVGELYRMFMLDRKKPPAGVADFLPLQEAHPDACRAVKDGSVVVVWGVNLTDLAQEESKDSHDEVLAYEKKVPDEGGTVLMKDRTIRRMTADEFRAAPKAGGK
jgi:hypothetical protein